MEGKRKKLQLSKLTCSRFWWVLSGTVAIYWLKQQPFFMIDRWFPTARAQRWNNLTKWDRSEMECRPLVSGLKPTCRGSIASILQRMNFSISCNIQMHLGLVDQYTYIIHLVSVYHSNTFQIHIIQTHKHIYHWLVVSTYLKSMLVKMGSSSPNFRVKSKNL